MNESSLRWGVSYSALLWALAVCAPEPAVATPQESVLYSFTGGADGAYPLSELLITKSGALIGTTSEGGDLGRCVVPGRAAKGCGVVFELTPPTAGSKEWKETVLYRFGGGADGAAPLAGVLMDKTGALYGVTSAGGGGLCHSYSVSFTSGIISVFKNASIGCGTIFKLTPPAMGSVWTEAVLHRFLGKDGRSPAGIPLMDKTGALYGVTGEGGEGPCGYFAGSSSRPYLEFPTGCGTVFKLTPPATGRDAWTLATLHAFASKPDGAFPDGGLIFAADGSLLGTTTGTKFGATTYNYHQHQSYHYGYGTVFKLTPAAAGGNVWTQTILYAFNPAEGDGFYPPGELIRGGGTLFGATSVRDYFQGDVFQLSPPSSGDKRWAETILHGFTGISGYPTAGLIRDPATAVLYGVTGFFENPYPGRACQSYPCGAVFSLKPPAAGNSNWTEAVLHQFGSANDGQNPRARLAIDKAQNLYGTTEAGGAHLYGTVFKVSP
jgi:hypothetical protein